MSPNSDSTVPKHVRNFGSNPDGLDDEEGSTPMDPQERVMERETSLTKESAALPKSCMKKVDTKSTTTSDSKKQVSYSSTAVRFFHMIIGDNPSVDEGVPVTIDWEHHNEIEYGVEDYENDHRTPTKKAQDMKLTPEKRKDIAKTLGLTDRKIRKISIKVKSESLTRKEKVIKTLYLDVLKENVRKKIAAILERREKRRSRGN